MIAQSLPLAGEPRLHATLWHRGDGSERGVLILVHGLGDHGGRFQAFAQRMVRRNWAVYAIDLPGHGRSPGRRGTAKNYDSVLAAIAAARSQLTEQFGGIDQYLIGHSMGGNFAVNYALRRQEFDAYEMQPLSGLILVAPMLMPPVFLDRNKIFAAWGTGHLFRWIRVSKPARAEQLTADAEVAQRMETDPLQHAHISLYLATQLLAQGRFALDHAAEIDTPTLVIQGSQDELIDQAAGRNLTLRMRDQADFICWPGGRHDLINDVDAEAIAQHLSQWMENAAPVLPLIELELASGDGDRPK